MQSYRLRNSRRSRDGEPKRFDNSEFRHDFLDFCSIAPRRTPYSFLSCFFESHNAHDENSEAPSMNSSTVEIFVFLSLGLFIILFRLFGRVYMVGWRGMRADDYLMLVNMLPYTANAVLADTVEGVTHGLTNSNMSDAERRALSPESEEYAMRVLGSKIQVAGWTMYVTANWIIKSSMCAFYLRLTTGVQGYRTMLDISFALIAASYIALMGCVLFACHPMERHWQIYPDPGNVCYPAISKAVIYTNATLNSITDLYLIVLPLPMLWMVKLPKLKKLGLAVLFSGAFFVIAACLLRSIITLRNKVNGPVEGAMWSVRECFVAVTIANLPVLWAFFRLWPNPFRPRRTRLGSDESRGRQESGSGRSEEGGGRRASQQRKPQSHRADVGETDLEMNGSETSGHDSGSMAPLREPLGTP
ncbi:hypothetical protein SODALDRAFT_326371 [Sodiomyces alkalinus F11]|uniref:Rhodopsin domain-containing protein n=1 Tax=Sodiomyces alkalinus (strain CBS 110278 / VKM F-3762 / F11) TaxID=1314773 RepID=A0A3N2Q6E9_SODAK|nr:hypothetical protein SODALDRAFT_326371 [Sodiomyces alkalinus F11]ROT42195.1 hypothetical protein SODALDRAFT_326371 [Sodiomyces alkalinus F11]